MKKIQYTESQIFQILKEAEAGMPVADYLFVLFVEPFTTVNIEE